MKQTAVEWLIEQFDLTSDSPIIKNVVDQAKAMEKEQIIDAYAIGKYINEDDRELGEQYYNETYINEINSQT
jgi:hypothetical protein